MLLPEVDFSASTGDRLDVWIEADWTFPLRFAEIVWGDEAGQVHCEITPLSRTRVFGAGGFGLATEARAGRGPGSRSGTWPATVRSSTRHGGSDGSVAANHRHRSGA